MNGTTTTGGMGIEVRIILFLLGLLWLLMVLRLVKHRRIWERYAILWVALGFAVLATPLLVDVFDNLLGGLGIKHPPSFYFLVGFIIVLAIILQCTVEITALVRKSRDAVQELAILEERIERLEKAAAAREEERTLVEGTR
jgi:hypothetical protein